MSAFWIVCMEDDSYVRAPQKSFEEAKPLAERLATTNIGKKVWILESKYSLQATVNVTWENCDERL